MAPARKAMKAMKAGGAMTASAAIFAVAEKSGLKSKDTKAIITSYLELAAGEIKKNGEFKIAGMLNLKLKKKPATPARKGVNPFTKEPCVFKAKPASKTVRAYAMKKLKEMVNCSIFLATEQKSLVGGRTRLQFVSVFAVQAIGN